MKYIYIYMHVCVCVWCYNARQIHTSLSKKNTINLCMPYLIIQNKNIIRGFRDPALTSVYIVLWDALPLMS